jgi:hypothetical protein
VDCRQMIFHSREVFPDAGKADPQRFTDLSPFFPAMNAPAHRTTLFLLDRTNRIDRIFLSRPDAATKER